MRLKSCPRCRGDLYLTSDWRGKYWCCIQCGYHKDVVSGSRGYDSRARRNGGWHDRPRKDYSPALR